jgi:putative transposase
MIPFISGFLTILRAFFCSRYNLSLEIMALRQRLGVLKRKNPRPSFRKADRLFWVLLRRLWSAWSTVLVIVKPETVVAWHCSGFRLFWRIRSNQARKLWAAFLHNHREVIAAMDFFTVPTLTFQVLYCFFIIEHGRRKILRFNVTEHPTGPWIVQQLREAFPESCPYRYAILDRDAKFGKDVTDLLASSGIKPKRISFRSPWQNGVAERWVGSCRRELLEHVIILNDLHLRRLIRDYISYYHEDRIHDSLEKDTPAMRPVAFKPNQPA